MEVSDQLHPPAALPPEEIGPGTHWIGGWAGPRAGLDVVEKRKTGLKVKVTLRPPSGEPSMHGLRPLWIAGLIPLRGTGV
jgi:hypothetical protein